MSTLVCIKSAMFTAKVVVAKLAIEREKIKLFTPAMVAMCIKLWHLHGERWIGMISPDFFPFL